MGKLLSKIKENAGDYVGVIRDTSLKERIIGTGLIAATAISSFFILQWDDAQGASIRKDVTADARAHIDGFDHVVSGGEKPVPQYRSDNAATVELRDGSTCTIKYVTSGGILSFHDGAHITDLGMCPSIKEK